MTNEPDGPIGRIYSVAEAAKALGIGRRKLDDLLREFPLYTPNGNRKLLNDDDIKELWKVRRLKTPPRALDIFERSSGPFTIETAGDSFESLRRLVAKPKRRKTRGRG